MPRWTEHIKIRYAERVLRIKGDESEIKQYIRIHNDLIEQKLYRMFDKAEPVATSFKTTPDGLMGDYYICYNFLFLFTSNTHKGITLYRLNKKFHKGMPISKFMRQIKQLNSNKKKVINQRAMHSKKEKYLEGKYDLAKEVLQQDSELLQQCMIEFAYSIDKTIDLKNEERAIKNELRDITIELINCFKK